MICSTAYAEQLHNHIQKIIHRMKHELHKSENDHSHTFIPSTFQGSRMAPGARTQVN